MAETEVKKILLAGFEDKGEKDHFGNQKARGRTAGGKFIYFAGSQSWLDSLQKAFQDKEEVEVRLKVTDKDGKTYYNATDPNKKSQGRGGGRPCDATPQLKGIAMKGAIDLVNFEAIPENAPPGYRLEKVEEYYDRLFKKLKE